MILGALKGFSERIVDEGNGGPLNACFVQNQDPSDFLRLCGCMRVRLQTGRKQGERHAEAACPPIRESAHASSTTPGKEAGHDGFRVCGHHLTKSTQEDIKVRKSPLLVKLTGVTLGTPEVESAKTFTLEFRAVERTFLLYSHSPSLRSKKRSRWYH